MSPSPIAHLHSHQADLRIAATTSVAASPTDLDHAGARWRVSTTHHQPAPSHAIHRLQAKVLAGRALQISASFDFTFTDWTEEVYVLAPGAIYAGNRFPVVPDTYPPLPPTRSAADPDQRPRVTRIPRLSAEPGPSGFAITSHDPSVPALGLWFPRQKSGLWFLTPERNALGLFGYFLEENAARDRAVLRIASPCVRPHAYEMCNDLGPSPDRPADLDPGQALEIEVHVHTFPCATVQDLFDAFLPLRHALVPPPAHRPELPLSAAWSILSEKFNRENWIEPDGYYAVGVEPMRTASVHQDWQAGWVGGMQTTHAVYLLGNAAERERVCRNFDFLFERGQAPSGLFYGVIHKGRIYGDHFRDLQAPWHLLRKSADVLFFGLSTLALMPPSKVKPAWLAGFRRCADAFVRLWDAHGQFGQFANHDTGELIVSGSLSAGIAPAGLVLAARTLPERAADYLRVALAAADHYDRDYLRHGLTNGGPGEIVQAPDSESAYGFLESLVTLAEHTGDPRWTDAARRCATQLATWVFPYDAAFPPDSTFGRMGMLATGTVLANAQNKHSAPGLCSASGLALLRLHRLTGDPFYMDLLRDIARAIPQYLSRADRPIEWKIPYNPPESPDIRHLKPGWMCERVNVCQWGPTELAGEVFYYSCWSEVALALTAAELPGVYARPDNGGLWCLDAVEAEWSDSARSTLRIHNPTTFPAALEVWFEADGAPLRAVSLDLPAGGVAVVPAAS